jgi:glycosyltransferase involved in cell wall biosynthesis
VIGWVGAGDQHLPHLRLLVKPLARLRERYSFVFRIIGVMGSRAIRELFDSKLAGHVEYVDAVAQEHLRSAVQEFDVGVMPLVDDPWSRGKCGYKALLTMACGVPTVASPVGVNRDIIHDKENGFLAGTEEEWFEALMYILAHPAEMQLMGKRGRAAVEERYSQSVCEGQLMQVFKKLKTGSAR